MFGVERRFMQALLQAYRDALTAARTRKGLDADIATLSSRHMAWALHQVAKKHLKRE